MCVLLSGGSGQMTLAITRMDLTATQLRLAAVQLAPNAGVWPEAEGRLPGSEPMSPCVKVFERRPRPGLDPRAGAAIRKPSHEQKLARRPAADIQLRKANCQSSTLCRCRECPLAGCSVR